MCLSDPLSHLQASCILQLVKYIQKLQQKDVEVAEEVSALFAGELNPVAPKAQKKVPVPDGWVVSVDTAVKNPNIVWLHFWSKSTFTLESWTVGCLFV